MKDDVLSGLQNAIERGSSLEKAVKSFINAGYNPHEVRAAAKMISSGGGVSSMVDIQPSSIEAKHILPPLPKPAQAKSSSQPWPTPKPSAVKKRRAGLIIAIIIALLAFLGALVYLIYTLTKGAG